MFSEHQVTKTASVIVGYFSMDQKTCRLIKFVDVIVRAFLSNQSDGVYVKLTGRLRAELGVPVVAAYSLRLAWLVCCYGSAIILKTMCS